MVPTSNALALLKVLLAAAWADADLSQSELNYIKDLARRFQLDDAEWFRLQPYLEELPSEAEQDAMVRDLVDRLGSDRERQAVLGHLKSIVESDRQVTPSEAELLRRYEEVLLEPSSMGLLLRRVRNIIQAPAARATVDLDEFLRNKILYKLRRRIDIGEVTPQMRRLALLGGLMGVVAQADGEIDERELDDIRRRLAAHNAFDEEALDLLTSVIREESVRGLDRHRLIQEYARDSGLDERIELLDLLFGVAAVDGRLTHRELEELRAISSALHLSHKQYIHAKLRAGS